MKRLIALLAVTAALVLSGPATAIDDPVESEQQPRQILPFDCEDWADMIEGLRDSDDPIERELGELYAEPDMAFCKTRRVRVAEPFEFDWDWDWNLSLPGLAFLAEFGRLLAVAALIALVAWLAWRWRHQAVRFLSGMTRNDRDRSEPAELKEQVQETQLPTDIPAQALAAWQAGQARLAMSLLYRGAVVRLLHDIDASQARTEREVLKLLDDPAVRSGARRYMNRLVGQWLKTAWAKSPPSEQEFQELIEQWPQQMPQPGGSG